MVRKTTIKRKHKSGIAFYNPQVISSDYVAQNRELHDKNSSYGVSVMRHLDTIKKLYEKIEARSLLDYGCGKGLLAKNLDFPIWEYDPAIVEKSANPRPADLVVCVDVLEHIEPEYLNSVLEDIRRCVKKVGYLVISTIPAKKFLPDGRNTHLIQENKDWWVNKLSHYFLVPPNGVFDKKNEIHIVVSPKINSTVTKDLTITAKEESLVDCAAA
jgi:2-polyprenyl-3-methyl-5-hydroxy-6-metoxy-1,4-benzoquinol methylase